MDFGPYQQLFHLSLGFIGGLGTVAWRIFGLFQKVAILQERVAKNEEHISAYRVEVYRMEDKLLGKLEEINDKIDNFVFSMVREKNA